MRNILKNILYAKTLFRIHSLLISQFHANIVKMVWKFGLFVAEFFRYKSLEKNPKFFISPRNLYPCLTDKTQTTPIDPIYFYQDAWAAGKIFKNNPVHHYDIGSAAKTIGIISQFVPTTMVDIRPVEVRLENLHFTKGTILDLPFADNSVLSISSLCVVEHIGLGRYGDPLDQFGSEKAIAEIIRVSAPKGKIYFSAPVDKINTIYFNAHRAFTPEYIRRLFSSCMLMEEKYIYGNELCDEYKYEKGYGVGLYLFEKL